MTDSLEDLLRACTVQVVGKERGTGFFVAPGMILTCAHVVGNHPRPMVRWARDGQQAFEAYAVGPALTLDYGKRTIPALASNYPDIAVIEVPGLDDQPCVAIDTSWPDQEDAIRAYGYPKEGGAELLSAAKLEYRGVHGTRPTAHLDLAGDTIKPGMSGGAVLNMRTGAVCGIVVATKHPERSDGGLAIHWTAIADALGDVLADNDAFHQRDQRWSAASARREPALPRTPVRRRKPPHFTRPLPRYFQAPEAPFETALAALLAPGEGGRARLVGLVGMGGAGKSALACALALYCQEQGAFDDGIIWLELGPHADPEAHQIHLAAELGVDQPAANSRYRLEHLNRQLDKASVLVILDDVWEHEQLRHFDLCVPESALLVTTRDRAVLGQSPLVRPVHVPGLPGADGDRLLKDWARLDRSVDLSGEPREVADYCDGLPLALAVAGAMVADKHSWRSIRDSIRYADLDDLLVSSLDYQEYENLFRVLDASVSCLPDQDRDCYLALAVFEGRGDVPVEIVFRLWQELGRKAHQSEHLIIRLAQRSLLTYDTDARTFTMHGLQFVYARHQLGPDRLRTLHACLAGQIMDAWGGLDDRLPGLCSSSLADPGERYGVLQLSAHLENAGRDDDIHRLLALDAPAATAPGQPGQVRNTWHAAHARIGEIVAYLADVRLAWNLAKASADRAFAAARPAAGIGLELRYALMSASMASMTAQIPRQVIVALVADGQWTLSEGRKHGWLLPTAEARAMTLVELLDQASTMPAADIGSAALAAELAAEASTAAGVVDDPITRASALTALAIRAADGKAAADALKAIGDIPGEHSRARAVAALAGRTALPKNVRDQAIQLADRCQGPLSKAIILGALVPRSPKPKRPAIVSQAWTASTAISQPRAQIEQLTALLCWMDPADQVAAAKRAIAAAEAMPAGLARASAYLTLAVRLLDEADRHEMLSRAQAAAGEISQPEEKAAALTALVPLVDSPGTAEQDALAAIDMITSPEATAAALTALAKVRGPARRRVLIGQACDAIRAIDAGTQPEVRAAALVALIALDHESQELLDETALAIGEISQPTDRAAAYTAAANRLRPGPPRSEMLRRALAEASAIDDAGTRATGIGSLVPHLSGPTAGLDGRRAVHQALKDARASGGPMTLASTVAALAPVLPQPDGASILKEACIAAHRILDPADRAAALTGLIPYLTEGRNGAVGHACAAARQIPDDGQRRAALSAVLSVAPDALTRQAERVARAAEDVRARLDHFNSALAAGGAPTSDRPTVRATILTTPALVLSADADLLPPLTPEAARRAISRSAELIISAIGELHSEATALLILTTASTRNEPGVAGGPAMVHVIYEALLRIQLLRDSESQLPDPLHDRVQAAIEAVSDAHSLAARRGPEPAPLAAARVQPDPPRPPDEPWNPYWRTVIGNASRRSRDALIKELPVIGPAVARFGGNKATAEAITALLDVGRWWP